MAYINKISLANFIRKKHLEEKHYEISELKLQKSLYLLYAYWAKNIRPVNEMITNNEPIEYSEKFDEDLFLPKFIKGTYGPIDKEAYKYHKNNNIFIDVDPFKDVSKNQKDTVISFINSILKQIFEINDFSLVDLMSKESYLKFIEDNEEISNDNIKNYYYIKNKEDL